MAVVVLGGSLWAQALPWFPSWDGKKINWFTAASIRQQIGVGQGTPGPQGPTGPQGPQGPAGDPATATDELIESTLNGLPPSCDGKPRIRYVREAHTETGGMPFYLCDPVTDTWRQMGYQSDGNGYLVVHCDEPATCLVGPNTAVVPSLPGPNAWTGVNDFTESVVRLP